MTAYKPFMVTPYILYFYFGMGVIMLGVKVMRCAELGYHCQEIMTICLLLHQPTV